MTSRIPSRQTLAGFGDVLIRVPMDGEGNATVANNLFVGGDSKVIGDSTVAGNFSVTGDSAISGNTTVGLTLDVAGNAHFFSNVIVDGALDVGTLVVSGSELIDGNLEVKGGVLASSFTTGITGLTGGNITCAAPGKFVGDGSGLTNLPIATLSRTPTFSVQSSLLDFSPGGNRFDPEYPLLSVVLTFGIEFVGRNSGLYYWQTTTNAESTVVQLGFNSASGWLIWDGSKINGVSTYSLTQQLDGDLGNLNPVYQLTWSEIGITSQTYMRVVIESTELTEPVNPIFAGNYFVEFYRVLPLSS